MVRCAYYTYKMDCPLLLALRSVPQVLAFPSLSLRQVTVPGPQLGKESSFRSFCASASLLSLSGAGFSMPFLPLDGWEKYVDLPSDLSRLGGGVARRSPKQGRAGYYYYLSLGCAA